MADTYWKICEGAAPSVQSPYHPVEWSCPCHGTLGERPLIPVPVGALLIEDGEDAARGRIVAELLEAFGVADEGLQVISSGRFGFRPEREWVVDLAAKVLRAAAGENG